MAVAVSTATMMAMATSATTTTRKESARAMFWLCHVNVLELSADRRYGHEYWNNKPKYKHTYVILFEHSFLLHYATLENLANKLILYSYN